MKINELMNCFLFLNFSYSKKREEAGSAFMVRRLMAGSTWIDIRIEPRQACILP